jgi:hypothetical protein
MRRRAACEIADELLRASEIDPLLASPLRQHVHFLLLLAHFHAAMLRFPSRDLAAAAILTSLRTHSGDAAAAAAEARLPRGTDLGAARACAAALCGLVTAAGQLEGTGAAAAAAAVISDMDG